MNLRIFGGSLVIAVIGLVLGVLIPHQPAEAARPAESSTTAAR